MTHSIHSDATNNQQHGTTTSHEAATEPPNTASEPLPVSLGRELREAREVKQLDLESCGQALRLPVRILKKLEAGDYSGIDHGVYLRNYLSSYATCVGLSEAVIQQAIEQLSPAERKPELVSTGGVPRSHYLWQRYTTAATYIVLTAVIVVPLVWLGLKGGLDRELTHLEPLNSAPVAGQQVAASARTVDFDGTHRSAASPHQPSGQVDEKPLMASMAPFSALDSVDNLPQKVSLPAVAVPGSHTLSITLTKPSWVEIVASDGKRLAYSLLPAGTHKTWHSSQPFHVSIGDTSGATVQLDDQPLDLDPYRHANVAHFRIALKDGQASVQAM